MTNTVMLIKVEANANNNKFYELTITPSGDTHARWGRVGATGQQKTYPGSRSFQSKMNEKLRKGYVVFSEQSDGAATVSTSAPAHTVELSTRVLTSLFPSATPTSTCSSMVDSLVRANRHAITDATGGKITVSKSTGAVTTALGPVSSATVSRARGVLDSLLGDTENMKLREEYLTLIPQPVRRVSDSGWVNPKWGQDQTDLLDALDAAVAMAAQSTKSDDADDKADAVPTIPFRYTLRAVEAGDAEFDRVAAVFAKTVNTRHGSVAGMKLRRLWLLDDEKRPDWDAAKKRLRHHRELWHGTSEGNVLSILRTGLICPPMGARGFNTAGRMFGDGVYFSDQGTKSLQYARGYAPGQSRDRSNYGRAMMFLTDIVMGNEARSGSSEDRISFTRRARTGKDDKGRSFDSLFVRGGHCGVMNNEMVVWNSDQIRITHLCEFE